MTPLFRQMTRFLIEATPEWWTEATLRVEVTKTPDGRTLSYEIRSEKNPQDVVNPTDDIIATTHELQALCEKRGEPWSAMEFRVEQENDRWRFTSEFKPIGLDSVSDC